MTPPTLRMWYIEANRVPALLEHFAAMRRAWRWN